MHRMILPAAALMMAVVAIVAMVAPRASAEETHYPDGSGREGAEMICKAYSRAFKERWSRRVGVFYKNLSPTRIRKMFRWAGRHLRKAYLELGAVPWPAEDQATAARWLKRIEIQPELLERYAVTVGSVGSAATTGDKRYLQHLLERRLIRNGELANSIVARFDFNYCRFNSGLLE